MESDKHMRSVPVEHELTFAGVPARVMLELDLGRNGATTLIPIGDLSLVREGDTHSTLVVPCNGALLRRVEEAVDDVEFRALD